MSPRDLLKNANWIDAAQKLGVATAVLLMVLGGVGWGLNLLANKVLVPLVDESVETTKELRKQLPIQTEIQRQVVDIQAKTVRNTEALLESQNRSVRSIESIIENDKTAAANRSKLIEQAAKQTEVLERLSKIGVEHSQKLDQIDNKLPAAPAKP